MWVFRGPSQRFHPVGQSSPRQASQVVTELKQTKGLDPNLLEKNPGILVENGITGGVLGEELRLESEKATKLADTLGWTCWDCEYFACLRYSGVTFCVNRVFFMFPISSSLCPEHRQRFPSPCFETYFKKICDRRLSFFHFYHSYLILKSYPQIESTSMFVWNWGTNIHQKTHWKSPARIFVCPPWWKMFLGGEASMLSAETIKEHDVRQNAGAQRLLKADGWQWMWSWKSGVKKRIVIRLSHVRVRLVIFEEKKSWNSGKVTWWIWGASFCFFVQG